MSVFQMSHLLVLSQCFILSLMLYSNKIHVSCLYNIYFSDVHLKTDTFHFYDQHCYRINTNPYLQKSLISYAEKLFCFEHFV